MLLSKALHHDLLCTEFAEQVVQTGLDFCCENDVPDRSKSASVSVWCAHVIVRIAHAVEDERWKFGCNIAAAHNRAWRDNLRAERGTVASRPIRAPHPSSRVYFRVFGNKKSNCHYVAYCPTNIIDLAFWRWRDDELLVKSAHAVWISMDESGDGEMPTLAGAEWRNYSVIPAKMDQMSKWFCTASRAAGEAIDALIAPILSQIKNAPPPANDAPAPQPPE